MGVSLVADLAVDQSAVLQAAVFGLLGIVTVLGFVAIVAPKQFARIADRGSQLVDNSQFFARLDQPVNLDRHVLRYSRIFGVAVVLSAGFLCWVFVNHVLK
jgi:hypothetical protein